MQGGLKLGSSYKKKVGKNARVSCTPLVSLQLEQQNYFQFSGLIFRSRRVAPKRTLRSGRPSRLEDGLGCNILVTSRISCHSFRAGVKANSKQSVHISIVINRGT